MQYFGVPTCPYCKKRVNIIRVWSMKKHGEFMCPRCKGISNIFLSPLVYVCAILAVAAGFLIYFFSKFVTDSVSLMTMLEVFIPFGLFFLLSLFFVYLEKPVIRRVKRTADGRYFDENGNEMRMKMGKLVAMTPNNYSANNNSSGNSAVKNSRPTVNKSVPRRKEAEEYTNYSDTSNDNYSESYDTDSFMPNDLPDNEDIYNALEKKKVYADDSLIKPQTKTDNVINDKPKESSFEDLFEGYSSTNQVPEKNQTRPARKTPTTQPRNNKTEKSGGTRFRNL